MDARPPAAGGFLIALGLLVGGAIGLVRGNSSLWLLIGLAVGVAAALAIWLIDRRR